MKKWYWEEKDDKELLFFSSLMSKERQPLFLKRCKPNLVDGIDLL